MSEGRVQHLFVYGTLAPGRQNAHMLEDVSGVWQKATVRGVLHEQGWGATFGFPAIILDDKAEEVSGYVLTSNRLADYWESLDAFEGEEYARVLTPVKIETRQVVEAFIYVLSDSSVSTLDEGGISTL